MTFSEAIVPGFVQGCPVVNGFCGTGVVVPFGHATETIVFGGGCSGKCDLRTITLSGGTLTLEEAFSNPSCPGACQTGNGLGEPFRGTLTDTIVSGTGVFEGASGTLTGTVSADGLESHIKLSGTITVC
jgi:hypothetical protein